MTVSTVQSPSITLFRWEAALIALAGMVSLFASYWDDAWHTDIGRDSAAIPPHVVLYGSVAVASVMVIAWGLRVLARTRSLTAVLRQRPLLLAGVGGAGTLATAAIDAAWHVSFGRDAVLWSPPHMLVVFSSTAMITGVLTGLPSDRTRGVTSGLAAVLLGTLVIAVMEYETDVPQFPETFYLPVLLAAGLLAAWLARRLVPGRAPVTAMVAIYVGLRLVITAVLALMGRTRPDLPIAVLGLVLIDLPWRSVLLRYAAGAAATSALAWVAAATHLASQRADAVAVSAVPLIVVVALLFIASARRGRPLALVVATAFLGTGTFLHAAAPAAAHDPGQGQPLAEVRLTGSSDGRGQLTMTLDLPLGCSPTTTPLRQLARRAGTTITGRLQTTGTCRYTGTVRVPRDGRWFVYTELRYRGRDVETWLPLDASRVGVHVETRPLYDAASAEPSTRWIEYAAGVCIYALGLTLLFLTVRQGLTTETCRSRCA